MVKVSGVPYEVDLPQESDVIAELERENAMMRARMQRLEDENRTLDALVFRLNTELMNLKNSIK
jgi:predicted RNase H-like nuclease (RuvC/YqgF family)